MKTSDLVDLLSISPDNDDTQYKTMPYNPTKRMDDNKIISMMEPTINKNIKKYAGDLPEQIQDDLYSIGLEAVNSALKRYDGTSRFNTWATMWIKNALIRAINYYKERGGAVASTTLHNDLYHDLSDSVRTNDDEKIPETSYDTDMRDPEAAAEEGDEETINTLFDIINSAGLSDNEKSIIKMAYGLGENGKRSPNGPMKQQEIANKIGVSTVRISQILKRASTKMKDYANNSYVRKEYRHYANLMSESDEFLIKLNCHLIWN